MAAPHSPNQNSLLAALTPDESARLTPYLELVPMPLGDAYYESAARLQYVYFPTTSILSLHCFMENGASAEIASVGSEGMFGISLLMNGEITPKRALVRTAGYGYKLRAQLLADEFSRNSALRQSFIPYSRALIAQMAQTTACNRYHTAEQQLCRWLLRALDRTPSNELILSHELIAGMLGIRREELAETSEKLQKAGLIHYRRGHITVLDRAGLKDRSCGCYQTAMPQYQRTQKNISNNQTTELWQINARRYYPRVELI